MLAAVLACCASPAETMMASRSALTLTSEDDGRTIDLRVGVQFAVRLKGTPGTGFGWELADRPAGLVKTLAEKPAFEACPDGQTGASLGAPACQVFRFETTRPGTGRLRLQYRRPWEKDVPPRKTFTIDLRIQ